MQVPVTGRAAALHHIPKRSIVIEIGVHKGDFSKRILTVARPETLYLVDPWKHFASEPYSRSHYGGDRVDQDVMDQRFEAVRERFKSEIASGQVEIRRDLSQSAAATFEDGTIDCVYIDGDHTYEGVVKDIEAYFPKLRSGGLMIGDDYNLSGWWGDGVCRAFHERLARGGCVIEFKIDEQLGLRKL